MRQKPKISLTMFDLLKGIIITLVLILHSFMYVDAFVKAEGSVPGRILLSPLMPCLFVVSGYWLGKRKFSAGLRNSVKSLLYPYLITGALILGTGFIHRLLIHDLREWRDTFLIPFLLVRSSFMGRIGALWFVFALFLAWLLFYAVMNLLGEKGQILAACLCAAAGVYLMPMILPFQISQSLVAFFYVYCGYQIKKKKLLEKEIPPWILIGMALLWIAGDLFGSLNLGNYKAENGLLAVPGNLCGAFLLIRLFLYLNVYKGKILNAFRMAGRYSLWILCIHSVEANVFPWKIMWVYFPRETVFGAFLHLVLRCVLITFVCHMMIRFKQNPPWKKRPALSKT